MTNNRVSKILIAGGGTAGWMTAAALSTALGGRCAITLVESDEIGIIGVGEATIPTIHWFNRIVGLDEQEFMRETKATYKLGIEFQDWAAPGHRYFHPFGSYGFPGDGVTFLHRWIRARQEGNADGHEEYSLNTVAARAGKFEFPATDPRTLLSTLGYAYHFDASLYARYLRRLSEAKGVKRIEGKIESIERHTETGFITALTTHKAERLEADLFIDCTGLRALLIEGALKVAYTDFSDWLPCDRAVAVPSERMASPVPYTRSIARAAGWQWRIPLQHRIGNGYVYSSRFMSDDEATQTLLDDLETAPLAEPRVIRFKTGRRERTWHKNVIAIGLSGGFLEPLESTSIHFIQSGIAKLLSLFPSKSCDSYIVEQYNRVTAEEFDGVRDFLVLHYHLTRDRLEPLWAQCRTMALPSSLVLREEQFARSGRIILGADELFRETSWFAVLIGQGNLPGDYNPLIDSFDSAANAEYLRRLKSEIQRVTSRMPAHPNVFDGAAMSGRTIPV